MHSKINIHNFWRSHTFIILIFAVMSALSAIILWHSNLVVSSGDFRFHWQRIYEIKSNIRVGKLFSLVMLNTFHNSGNAVLASYPALNLIPVVALSFVFKNIITLVYVIFILRNFFALIIGYWSSYDYNHNKKISFLFTTIYTLNTTTLYHSIYTADLGRSGSLIFLPLILFGFLKLIDNNKWIELTIGMTTIILCHIINSVIAIMLICCLIIFNIKKFNNKDIFKSLFKSIIITIMIASVFWLPFLIIITHNQISMPVTGFKYLDGNHIWSLISSLRNRISPSISLLSFFGLLVGLVEYKKISLRNKKLLWIAIIFLFLCSNIFPWHLVSHIFPFIVTALQFPYRFFIVPQLLLCYIFAANIFILFKNPKRKRYIMLGVTLIALFTQLLGQEQIIYDAQHNGVEIYDKYSFTDNKSVYIKNNKDMSIFFNDQNIHVIDYYPQAANKFSRLVDYHIGFYNRNNQLKTQSLGNGVLSFKSPQNIKELSLPFLYYNGIDYQVKLDGRTVNGYANKHALMTINNVSKGKHHVQIIVHKTKAEMASYVLSFAGLVILLGAIIKSFILKRKNK